MAKRSNNDGVQIPDAAQIKEDDRNSRWTAVSAIFIAIVVVVGIICFFSLRSMNADDRQAQEPHVAQDESSASLPDGDDAPESGTDIRDRFYPPTTDNQGVRLEVPKDPRGQLLPQSRSSSKDSFDGLQWQKVLGMAMPFTTGAGPTTMTKIGTPGGFAHTENGAVLAAWQLQWRLVLGPGELRSEILKTSAVSEEGYGDQQRTAIASMPEKFSTVDTDTLNTIAPYLRVEAYDGDIATISFGAPDTTGSESGMVTTVTVLWRDGAWKLFLRGPNAELQARDVANFEGWGRW